MLEVYLLVICMFEFTFTFQPREENPFNFCGVIIQYVYCSWLTGFLLMASQSEKKMTDASMSTISLSGGMHIKLMPPEILPVSLSVYLCDNMEILTFLWF